MRDQFIGLIECRIQPDGPPTELCGRLHQIPEIVFTVRTAGWKIEAKSQHDHTPQGGQHVVLEAHTYVPNSISGEIRRLPFAIGSILSKAIDVVMRTPHIGERELESKPFGETVVQVERRDLRNSPGLLMMIEDHLPFPLVDPRDDSIGSIQ